MTLTARAAICFAANQPLPIETVEVAAPLENEVLIKIPASGPCHSDVRFIGRRSWNGSVMGGARRKDAANLLALSMQGKIDPDKLVSHRFRLEDINAGLDLMRHGKSVRSAIVFG